MTRRSAMGLIATAATAAAAPPAGAIDRTIVERHDEEVNRLLAEWKQAPERDYYARSAGTAAGRIDLLMAAILQPQSKFANDARAVDRLKEAARDLGAAQHPDGRIDLLDTNFDSTPDTGFVVHTVATACCLARRANRPELARLLEPFLRKAGDALITGGIHTPNHRWVVSSALAQLHELFPQAGYLRRIDQWLAEGIDIDADGQFTERSTSVYNAVCDRAFVVMAAKLQRPGLLGPVRRNLQAMMYLTHPDGEAVTEISHRQDRGVRADLTRYWFPLRYMAVKDGNGQFAAMEKSVEARGTSLSALMEYPEVVGPMPAQAPLPDEYERRMEALGIVRFRRRKTSATLLTDDPAFFTLRHGAAVIEGVRFASAFFGKGQFSAPVLEGSGNSYVLRQRLGAGYYQPLDPPQQVTPANWARLRERRRVTEVCQLEQVSTVTQTPRGFRVRVQVSGTDRVPAAIEVMLRTGGTLEGCTATEPGIAVLEQGYATYRQEGDSIRFGPGLREHAHTQVRGALPKEQGQSVYLTAFSPFDHTLEFECG